LADFGPSGEVSGVSVATDDLVRRLMDRDPARRPASAGEVYKALVDILGSMPTRTSMPAVSASAVAEHRAAATAETVALSPSPFAPTLAVSSTPGNGTSALDTGEVAAVRGPSWPKWVAAALAVCALGLAAWSLSRPTAGTVSAGPEVASMASEPTRQEEPLASPSKLADAAVAEPEDAAAPAPEDSVDVVRELVKVLLESDPEGAVVSELSEAGEPLALGHTPIELVAPPPGEPPRALRIGLDGYVDAIFHLDATEAEGGGVRRVTLSKAEAPPVEPPRSTRNLRKNLPPAETQPTRLVNDPDELK
jgi:hypothetical protein